MNSLLDHLPILLVALPLIGAPLCVLLGNKLWCWLLTVFISITVLLGAAYMLGQTWQGQVFEYALGGWQPPWGISYQVTSANALIAMLVGLIATAVSLYAKCSVSSELAGGRLNLFFAAFLLCLSGLLGVTVSNDLFNIFIFLEIASLSSYTLVAFASGGKAPLAALRYLLAGSLGATFLLIGIGYLYALTGTLNLDDLALRLPDVTGTRAALAAFAFISFGLLIKIALFPLHAWQPDVYTHAPSVVSAWLSATSSKVAIYLLLRLFLEVFAPLRYPIPLDTLLLALASGGILFGAVIALGQSNVKRLLAYSSVSQVAYILLGAGLGSAAGVKASLIHLFSHSLTKAGMFLALGAVVYRLGGADLQRLTGLSRQMPWTAAAITLGGLSLIGIPLTSGFISKWYLIDALLQSPQWPLAVVIIVGSLIAVAYVWRIVERIYARPEGETARAEAPLPLLIPTWVLIGLSIYFGIRPNGLIFAAGEAADTLLGK